MLRRGAQHWALQSNEKNISKDDDDADFDAADDKQVASFDDDEVLMMIFMVMVSLFHLAVRCWICPMIHFPLTFPCGLDTHLICRAAPFAEPVRSVS